jgi:ribosomal protein L40E
MILIRPRWELLTFFRCTTYNCRKLFALSLLTSLQRQEVNKMNPETSMDCRSCAATNPAAANFCWRCGSRFERESPTVPVDAVNACELSPSGVFGASVRTHHSRSWKRIAVMSVIGIALGLGLTQLVYTMWGLKVTDRDRQQQAAVLAEQKIKFGLRITAVRRSSPAEICGLQIGDIIIRYAGVPVNDITSYVAALDAQDPNHNITFTVFRNGTEIDLTARPGRMGFDYEDWNPTRNLIYDGLRTHNNYGGSLNGVELLAANAERDGALTPAQVLIVKILLIPDRSSIAKEQERSEMLSDLFSIYPSIHLAQLANTEFYPLKSYAAAARCYEEQLELFDEDDVDVRLNLALAYLRVLDFDNAERNVNYVAERRMPLSAHGVHVVQEIRGGIALGRNRNEEALSRFLPYAEKGDEYDLLMSLLAAEKMNDLDRFYEIRDRAAEATPENIKRQRFLVDCLNACLLAGKGKNDKAAALVLQHGSAQCVVDTAGAYWVSTPGASDIGSRLQKLLSTE